MKIPIKDGEKRLEGWYKDDRTGAIQCSDKAKYEQYMKQYRACLLYTSPSPRD